ncbi:MAG TPA: SDR family NAD(P)-dependent oxidoreductase [Thermoanaerobaculia bacterium]|nr:SDR family NAD(P)-dependent oxidoreductase [Thermoanaerobaculia bacterium]
MHRTAIITGASRGLGRTVAEFLAAQSHDLVITSRGEEDLETAARELRRYGGQVIALAGDVADPAHRQRLAQAARGLGRLDVLLNNASTLGATPLPPLAEYPADELEEAFRVNVSAPLALVREVLPLLEASGGLIVNVSSDAALGGYPGWGGYGLTKAALDLASLTLGNELRDRGIGVVAVDPGDLRTSMHQAAFPGEDISDRPLPEVTLPFWAWLFGQPRAAVTGRRYRAQAERWEVNVETLEEVAV